MVLCSPRTWTCLFLFCLVVSLCYGIVWRVWNWLCDGILCSRYHDIQCPRDHLMMTMHSFWNVEDNFVYWLILLLSAICYPFDAFWCCFLNLKTGWCFGCQLFDQSGEEDSSSLSPKTWIRKRTSSCIQCYRFQQPSSNLTNYASYYQVPVSSCLGGVVAWNPLPCEGVEPSQIEVDQPSSSLFERTEACPFEMHHYCKVTYNLWNKYSS